MAWYRRCGARRFQYRAILPKERDIDRILSSSAFFSMPGDLFWSSRPRSW